MKYWLISPVAVLCLGGVARAQGIDSFTKIPERPATARRIPDVPPKSPFVQRTQPQVEKFDRQRALEDRQQRMLDGQPAAPKNPTQLASATQSVPTPALPPTQVIAPRAAVSCDCETSAKIPSRQWRRLLREEQCAAARDMVPHYTYQAPYDGAYYFRPYVAAQIGKQADIVGGWNLDRTNPYDNRFLQAIYDQPRQKMGE